MRRLSRALSNIWLLRINKLVCFGVAFLLAACSAATTPVPVMQTGMRGPMNSVSPASIPVKPMVKTPTLGADAMPNTRAQLAIQPASYAQIDGTATRLAPAQDGSFWALSDQPSGPDKYIWHFANGWTNIPGLASRISAGPDGSLFVINSSGGVYGYSNGTWSALGGGATDITAGPDGSVYVASNDQPVSQDQGIWKYQGSWQQIDGSGVQVAASWDTSKYVLPGGTISSGGIYITNALGYIYYENTDGSFVQIPGQASLVAPGTTGGLFVLAYPASAGGSPIYYYDLSNPGWTQQPGNGTDIASYGSNLLVVGSMNGIYSSPITVLPQNPACSVHSVSPQVSTSSASHQIPSQGSLQRAPERGKFVPGVLEVIYASGHPDFEARDRATLTRLKGSITEAETFGIVTVPDGTEDDAIAALQALPNVRTVARAQYRYLQSTAAVEPNDPYWSQGGAGQAPLYQSSTQSGQWDMHLICVSHAFGYAQSFGNTLGPVSGALADDVKIAIIDSGVDPSHPEIASKIVYGATFVNGFRSVPMHDYIGHGTNVAGIAAANPNNGIGFVGAGYDAKIMAYNIFPDPPNNCSGLACETNASTSDEALAIEDAISHGASLINISIGGPCFQGGDPAEKQAVTDALAHGIPVVAAAGNGTSGDPGSVDCPAAETGVIAVGASALTDSGVGSAVTGEHAASYSNYDFQHLTTWGLVAPGGDPTSPTDPDTLHWIDNIWTTTAASAEQHCGADLFGSASDCNRFSSGTSQAAAHVSGIVALLLGASPGIAPANIRSILCSTAINIGSYTQGCGRVDAYRAMSQVLGDTTVP